MIDSRKVVNIWKKTLNFGLFIHNIITDLQRFVRKLERYKKTLNGWTLSVELNKNCFGELLLNIYYSYVFSPLQFLIEVSKFCTYSTVYSEAHMMLRYARKWFYQRNPFTVLSLFCYYSAVLFSKEGWLEGLKATWLPHI